MTKAAGRTGDPLLLLAGGSNVVIGDEGFAGTAILIRSRGVEVISRRPDQLIVRVQAGHPWDEFVAETVEAGWSGVECLSGIPGSTGATPIQNVGAYGQDVSETIRSVTVYDRADGVVRDMPAADCGFGYRASVFKHNDRYVVLTVDFRLLPDALSGPVRYAELARSLGVEQNARVPLAAARESVLALRAGKGMVLDADDRDTWSVGSFFTNPVLDAAAWEHLRTATEGIGEPPGWPGEGGRVKVSAAWLIDRAGFGKGYPGGDVPVSISTKHTLALTNRGSGTTAQLLGLAREIRDGVRERFGVVLHPEPVLVGCEI
ncbi:UDP-N-acetylmuramate dehydrogenase [Catenuloplanes atrovinosus]|uniref:UDP-N-acetylenolpyruvoylglucosamine reductase n=1 Tax=Catenuloplanes atrovinosus TaxID=137266 RepID=A0AAE3YVI1_9ACTN|nr:UDP-N-acetylmuramate dehydrogenase [Catenuloplanes atrovinosus]